MAKKELEKRRNGEKRRENGGKILKGEKNNGKIVGEVEKGVAIEKQIQRRKWNKWRKYSFNWWKTFSYFIS